MRSCQWILQKKKKKKKKKKEKFQGLIAIENNFEMAKLYFLHISLNKLHKYNF